MAGPFNKMASATETFVSKVYNATRDTRWANDGWSVETSGLIFAGDLGEISSVTVLNVTSYTNQMDRDLMSFVGDLRTLSNAMGFPQV